MVIWYRHSYVGDFNVEHELSYTPIKRRPLS